MHSNQVIPGFVNSEESKAQYIHLLSHLRHIFGMPARKQEHLLLYAV